MTDVESWKIPGKSTNPSTTKEGGDLGGKGKTLKQDGGDLGGKGGKNRKQDGGDLGGKGKALNVTRNISIPLTGNRKSETVLRTSTLVAANGQVQSRQITANNVLTERVICEYADLGVGTIQVSERKWSKDTQRETVAILQVDKESRQVFFTDEEHNGERTDLRYDAGPAAYVTPASFEAALYAWATTRDANRAADAKIDKQKRFFRTDSDLQNNLPGSPFFESMVRYDNYGRVSKVEMCFADTWAECSPIAPVKWVTYIKPLKKRSRGSASIAIWTDQITSIDGKIERRRIRSEVLVVQTTPAKVTPVTPTARE